MGAPTRVRGDVEVNGNVTVQGSMRMTAAGKVRLAAGVATVPAPMVTAASIVFLTPQGLGGTAGLTRVENLVPGTGFDIRSANVLDTSMVGWFVVEPAGT